MRRVIRTASALIISLALASPLMAQNRGRNNAASNTASQSSSAQRPANSNNGSRPGGNGGAPSTPSTPPANSSNMGNSGSTRPGNMGNMGSRPSSNNRPSHGAGNNVATPPPSHNPGPGGNNFGPGGHGPGHNPGPGSHGLPNYGTPHRPYMPPPRPYYRPTPPPVFNGYRPFPTLRTVLGVTFGTALDYSLYQLMNSGYIVQGYNNNQVYLTNVRQLNFYWPNATLYFSNGYLTGSEFVYSTPAYDMSRYNMAYNILLNTYGIPYSVQNINAGISATWWGNNGQFITLSYMPEYAMNGTYRYYTTLSYGN